LSNYIDLHNHILPAIDDGPQTMPEAIDLARAMVDAGFGTVVATPHACEGKPDPAEIFKRTSAFQAELNRQGVPLKILPGSEQHIEPALLERLQKKEALTLNNTRYLLLELPFFQPLPPYTLTLIDNLVTAGYVPLIAHPERASDLQANPNLISELHQAGALFQLTWSALTGKIGPAAHRVAHSMVEAGLGHFFATDAHSASGRLMKLEKSSAIIAEMLGPAALEELLITRPARLLADQPLDLPLAQEDLLETGGKLPLISRLRRHIGR